MQKKIAAIFSALIFLASCASPATQSPLPTATQTQTPAPTATVTPTNTHTPEPIEPFIDTEILAKAYGEDNFRYTSSGDLEIKRFNINGYSTDVWDKVIWEEDGQLHANLLQTDDQEAQNLVFSKDNLGIEFGDWVQEDGIMTVSMPGVGPYDEVFYMPELGGFVTGVEIGVRYGGEANYIHWNTEDITNRRVLRAILLYSEPFAGDAPDVTFYIAPLGAHPGALLSAYPLDFDANDPAQQVGRGIMPLGAYTSGSSQENPSLVVVPYKFKTHQGDVVWFLGRSGEALSDEENPLYPDGKTLLEHQFLDPERRRFFEMVVASFEEMPWDIEGGLISFSQPGLSNFVGGVKTGNGWELIQGLVSDRYKTAHVKYWENVLSRKTSDPETLAALSEIIDPSMLDYLDNHIEVPIRFRGGDPTFRE